MLFDPCPLLAKKDKEPPADVIYKHYPHLHPDELKANAIKAFKQEFESSFKQGLEQAMNRPYGSWHISGMPKTDVAVGGALPFGENKGPENGLSKCDKGNFEFVVNGVYSITFGIVDSNQKCKFELQKKSKDGQAFESIPGGILIYKYENGSSNSLTVLIQAEVGDVLKVVNTHTNVFKLGTQVQDQVCAYITIHQIH
jgi:hypothetical protein